MNIALVLTVLVVLVVRGINSIQMLVSQSYTSLGIDSISSTISNGMTTGIRL